MAKFDESKVINALHPEKAEVGKKYYFCDSIIQIKDVVENGEKDDDVSCIGELTSVIDGVEPFRKDRGNYWELLYPYKEPPKQRMTNIQLMEWLAKGNGMFKYKEGCCYCYTFEYRSDSELNMEVAENIIIRTWDSSEWVEPTVDIYERDCKGGK